jgi:hypothetical protein
MGVSLGHGAQAENGTGSHLKMNLTVELQGCCHMGLQRSVAALCTLCSRV